MALRNQDYARQLAVNPAPAKAEPKAKAEAKSESSFTFGDFLDIINPLQHIPVVSTIYRHLTGDKIDTPEKIAGDALFGGLTGLACSVGDVLFAELTGKSVGDTVYAALIGDDEEPTTGVAQNDPKPEPAAVQTAELWQPSQTSPYQAAAAYRASGRLLAAY